MTLDDNQAIEVIKRPQSKHEISSVELMESQLRVFTEEMDEDELRAELYWKKVMSKMEGRARNKFDIIKQYFRYPLPVVQLCDSVLNDFFKVFEGKNRHFNVEGDRNIGRLEDWIYDCKPERWIETQSYKVFKNKPNSFVVIDIDSKGEPYMVLVDTARLVDAKFKDQEGDLEYIAFVHSKRNHEIKPDVTTTFYAVYDDETYRVFRKDSDSDKYILESSNPHQIGYCPAKSFLKSTANSSNPFKRRAAFSAALSKLEDWTMFDVFRNYVDHYAPFPVTESPKKRCPNAECQEGKISSEVIDPEHPGETKTIWKTCPACEGNDQGSMIYPGTHIGIKVRADKTENDGSGIFRMIFPDTDKMKYVPEKLDDLELEIRYKTAGLNTLMSNEAFNKLQVRGSFATMESILLRTKKELDVLYKWIVETVGKIFYKNIFLEVEANFGTEFYLISEEDLQKRYQTAKQAGLPYEELLMIYLQLIETKYKGNNAKIERQKMMIKLDPLPLYSPQEAVEMRKEQVIDDFDLSLKINFLNFIAKFEAENAPITQFGINLEPWQRIEKIRETLIIYNNEQIRSKQLAPGPEGVEQT